MGNFVFLVEHEGVRYALGGHTGLLVTIRAQLGRVLGLCAGLSLGVAALLADCGWGGTLGLELPSGSEMKYCWGSIFRGYRRGLASGGLAGGRYDNLLKKMGREGGAIGFAVYLDQFQRLLAPQRGYDADVLLLYDGGQPPASVAAAANAILASGKTVRVEREIPDGFRYRELRDLRKEV